jgi:hypothetical protein
MQHDTGLEKQSILDEIDRLGRAIAAINLRMQPLVHAKDSLIIRQKGLKAYLSGNVANTTKSTVWQCIASVLQDASNALTTAEIIEEVGRRSPGTRPQAIHQSLQRHQDVFIRVRRGIYRLRSEEERDAS